MSGLIDRDRVLPETSGALILSEAFSTLFSVMIALMLFCETLLCGPGGSVLLSICLRLSFAASSIYLMTKSIFWPSLLMLYRYAFIFSTLSVKSLASLSIEMSWLCGALCPSLLLGLDEVLLVTFADAMPSGSSHLLRISLSPS